MKRSQRKRRISWIDVTFSIAIITLTFTAIYLISQITKIEAFAINEKKNTSTVVIVDTINSNYPGIKIVTETSNDPFSPYAIQYPQSTHEAFNEEVMRYIENAKLDYLKTMRQNKKLNSKKNGELNISFETIPHHSGTYSFVLVNDTFTGIDDELVEVRTFHLNPEMGKQISIDQVFGHDPEKLSTIVRETIYNNPIFKENIIPQNVHLLTEADWENFSNFAISDETILFYYHANAFSTNSTEPAIVEISLQDVNDLLTDEFKLPFENNVLEENEQGEKTTESETKEHSEETVKEDTENDHGTTIELDQENPSISAQKRVALTFDDGPDPKVTTQILETLKSHNAIATFFMLGSRVEYYPEIAKLVQEAGHELGNHTWTHPDLRKLSADKVQSEINRTSTIIEDVTGQSVTVFRPPYGAVNQSVLNQTSLPVVLWDVDTLDWKHHDANKLLQNVKAQTKDDSIILMHDIHQSTADGLDEVLSFLLSEGYKFVPVSELVE